MSLSTIFQYTGLFVCLILVFSCFQQSFSVLMKLECLVGSFVLVYLFYSGFPLLSLFFQCIDEARVSVWFVCLLGFGFFSHFQ